MGDKTGIQWTDATWNPVVGCAHVSPGCGNCYAAREAAGRLSGLPEYEGLAVRGVNGVPRFTGEVRTLADRLDQPMRWRRPRRIFVNSMSDLFHPYVPTQFIVQVFDVMANCPRHTFQVLTKRPGRMKVFVTKYVNGEFGERAGYPVGVLPNVWLGVSIESDQYVWRANLLRDTPAAVRWISAEPLLGPLDHLTLNGIDWLVVGGESGPGARPMHPEWVRDLRDRCAARTAWSDPMQTSGAPVEYDDPVAFVFKQWGEWAPRGPLTEGSLPVDNDRTLILHTHGNVRGRAGGSLTNHLSPFAGPGYDEVMERVGKRSAGRLLDGRTWDEYPGGAGS